MKRIAWILGAVALAALALFVLLVLLLPRESLKTGVGEQIAAWTGRDVSLRGEPDLSFFPRLTVTLKDVRVAGPAGMDDAEIVSMDRLSGEVRLLPLVIGRVEIGSYRMVRPLIRLIRDDRGVRNWAFDSGAAALQLAFAGDVPLGSFVIEDGTLVYQNRRDGIVERVDSLNLALEWESVRQPLVVSGSGIWRGEQVAFSATANAPFEFIKGETTPLEANLDSVPLDLSFTGTAANMDAPRFEGEVDVVSPSLRGFAAWLGSPIKPGSTLGPAQLSGAAVFTAGTLAVENAQLSLDGNSATGALEVTAARRPAVTGTLAFPLLDLTPYFAGVATAFQAGEWRSVELDTGWFQDFSADIRLSAGTVQLGGFRFGETAATASLREARLEIGVAEAAFSGGTLAGDLAVTPVPEAAAARIEAQIRATDFDLAALAPILDPSSLKGTASLAADVAGAGGDLGSLISTMEGAGTASVRNGAVPLFGIAEMATAAAGAAASAEPAGTTPVESLTAPFMVSGGAVDLHQARVVGRDFSAMLDGRIGLLDGALDLQVEIQPSAAAAPTAFAIDGSIARPVRRPRPPTN